MFLWLHHLLNPHCPECREEREDTRICQSCETLKSQLEIANLEKQKLLDRLLEKPQPEIPREPVQVTRPVHVPWNVRRQMLEAEDRRKAQLMKQAPQPISTEDLEKELDVASEAREAEGQH